MRALHPQASFEPIPPDLDLHALVDNTPNFEWVVRISAAQIRNLDAHDFEKLVRVHVIQGGKPLVIEKWDNRLSPSLFSAQWLEQTYDKKQENIRDLVHQSDIPMTTGHYLRSMRQLANQWTTSNYRDDRRQRLYLKDIDCPPEWHDRLQSIIPPTLFYFNTNVDSTGGDQSDDGFSSNIVAPAGDLMSSLPEEMRAQNLMCYIGHEGTYTPAHREMCASLGQNIMVEASGDEHGEKPGSSIWFMTESKDREVVREYFLSMLGHDIEIEKHFAQINAWKKAHFPVYIVEQRPGDFILVPPLAPHQVWNRGTRTIKVAWNRTTVETLELALSEALPKARLVCRDEQYKNKAIIYHTLRKYYRQMKDMDETAESGWMGINPDLIRNSVGMKRMAQDFKKLFALFATVLVDEMFATKEAHVEFLPFDSNVTCSYCRSNIFNRFLTCKHCVRGLDDGGEEDTYDVCMECYAMGRSCLCISRLSWCEQWKWSDLVDSYEDFRAMIIKNDGYVDIERSPLPIEVTRNMTGKKSIAQICQEQLRRRPWKDITKPEEPSGPEQPSEPEIGDDGRPKKRKARKRKKGDVFRCHVCCHMDYRYRLAFCSNLNCTEAYCYGVLYRAFDTMPQTVMQDERWECPRCRKICNCGACRRAGTTNPYMPKMTLLGHDTRAVADDRSVESLVDFRLHNLGWLKATGDDPRRQHSRRMQRLTEVANAEKAKEDSAGEVAVDGLEAALQQSIAHGPADNPVSDGAAIAFVANGQSYEVKGFDAADAEAAGAVDGMAPVGEDLSFIDPSSYPDPSMLSHERMIGRGYYQQDESEDRILFDPYQAPSADAVAGSEQAFDHMKRAIRTAKRRILQKEGDDPDFESPKQHAKKRKKPEQDIDMLPANMDPALMGEQDISTADWPAANEADMAPNSAEAPVDVASETDFVAAANTVGSVDSPSSSDGSDVVVPNVPELRHARPKVSYVEADDREDEFSDSAVAPAAATQEEPPETALADPIDLATDAVRALTGTGPPASTTKLLAAPQPPRPRGRPGRPRKSGAGPSKTATPPTQPRKKRGRPPRASLPVVAAEESAEPSIEARDEADSVADELERQLARELAEEHGPTIIVAQPSTSIPEPVQESKPLKRRGRPPKARFPEPESRSSIQVEIYSAAPSTALMSMAERMALPGKKFRIGKRKAPGAREKSFKRGEGADGVGSKPAADEKTTEIKRPEKGMAADKEVGDRATPASSRSWEMPSPEPMRRRAYSDDGDEFVPEHEPSSSPSAEASPAVTLPVRPGRASAGPTVVQLMDSDREDDSAPSPYRSESSSSDGDADIPNRPRGNFARRGRPISLRGRGSSGRGRGRGRGRARGRGHG